MPQRKMQDSDQFFMKTKFTSNTHFHTRQCYKERKKGGKKEREKEKKEANTFDLQRFTEPGCTQLFISTP